MTTEDLIASLTAEVRPVRKGLLRSRVMAGFAVGISITLMLFLLFWGVRPDVGLAVRDPFFAAKTILSATAMIIAFPIVMSLARPGARTRAAGWIWTVPAGLACCVAMALLTRPLSGWLTDWVGHSILTCLLSIPMLSLPILAGLLAGLRHGAPEHPVRCGAFAGLLAGATATLPYSIYCTEDSPLFYGTWYVLAIGSVTCAGAWLGSRVLRW